MTPPPPPPPRPSAAATGQAQSGGAPPAAAASPKPQGVGHLTADALELAAQKYLQTGQMPALSMGKSSAIERAAILNRAAAIAKENGTMASDVPTQQALFHSASIALTNLERQKAAVGQFERAVVGSLDILTSASAKVDRTGSPFINKYILYLKGQVKGDADTQLLENAVRTSASEYAKVMSGGTGTASATEGVRAEAAKSLNASFSNNTTKKVIEQMKLEMRKRMDGFDQQIEETKKTLKENPASAKPSTAAQYLQLIK
jgi:hypothetical protein